VRIDGDRVFEVLVSRIIGQNTAMRDLADATQIHLAQITPHRPETIFMAGPTGVGKTESAVVLSETLNELSGTRFELIRINCNQLMESHRVSQLLGSPAGYVGYSDPPMLAPLVGNRRCIVLFDEIEKAHLNVLKVLMGQVSAIAGQ